MEELNSYFENTGRLITGSEAWEVMQRWRETFSTGLKENTGKWTIGEIDWHVFSYGYFPYLKGNTAEERFERRSDEGFYVSSSGKSFKNKAVSFAPSSIRRQHNMPYFLEINPDYYDLYFFGENSDWTMVYTHEPDFDKIYAEI